MTQIDASESNQRDCRFSVSNNVVAGKTVSLIGQRIASAALLDAPRLSRVDNLELSAMFVGVEDMALLAEVVQGWAPETVRIYGPTWTDMGQLGQTRSCGRFRTGWRVAKD